MGRAAHMRRMSEPAPPAPPTGPGHVHDVLIAGGGLVGGTLALALAREGLSVALIDARPSGGEVGGGRAYALALASRRVLGHLGLWERVSGEAQPILAIRVADGRPGEAPSPRALGFDHAEIEEGPMGHMVEDRHLRPALDAALLGSSVERVAGRVAAQEVGPRVVTATLADGRRLSGRLLAGCDGVASGVARRAGIRRLGRPYGQTAVTVAIRHERPHRGMAQQLFLPTGPLAVLPLRGDRSSLVWSTSHARAATLMRLDDEGFLRSLRPVLGTALGEAALDGPRAAHPLALSLAESLVAARVALVGDAGHAVHPVAGQGLNAGLRDVAALAEVLGEARRRGEDPGAPEVLGRYAQWRRFDLATLALATDGVTRLFSTDAAPLRLARDLGLGLVNRLSPLRRALIREAAGLTGDLPRLMR